MDKIDTKFTPMTQKNANHLELLKIDTKTSVS